MIRYALSCQKGHGFESWFKSSADYDKQAARGLIGCPLCGSTKIGKAIMAPGVARSAPREMPAPQTPAPAANPQGRGTNAGRDRVRGFCEIAFLTAGQSFIPSNQSEETS